MVNAVQNVAMTETTGFQMGLIYHINFRVLHRMYESTISVEHRY